MRCPVQPHAYFAYIPAPLIIIYNLQNTQRMKFPLTLVLILFTVTAFCQDQLQKEASGMITFASAKVVQLVDAVPDDKLDWAPADGVRSFRDVFTHIVTANYFFGSKLGPAIPASVNMETLAKDLKTKDQLKAALKDSYEFAIAAVRNTKSESLPAKVEYPFPGEFTNMSSVLILATHSNEHLGQLIAYARMNGITPPWSR